MTGGEYFTIAQPIAKEDFLSLYQEVSLLAKLVFAPYGVSSETLSLLGRESFLSVYGSVYQQLEDVLSKCLFKFHGLEDDRVVASMHKFVGQTQDEQIMSEIKPVRETLLRLASPPQVVEFSFSRETDLDALLSAHNATSLQETLSRAIARLRAIAREVTQGNKKNDENNNEDNVKDDKNDNNAERASNVDERVQQFFGITIARRVASPILELFSLTTKDSPQLAEALSALLRVLRVRVPVRRAIDSHDSNHVGDENTVDKGTASEEDEELSLSFEQYVALFEQLHAQRDALQSGESESESNWFLHPVIAFVLQLSRRMKSLSESENESVSEEEKERMDKSLSFTLRALSALSQCAKEDDDERDGEQTVSLLSDELLDVLQDDEDDVVVPVFLHVQLLLARAKAHLSVGDAGAAFFDIQRALGLDPLSAAAYTVRSELLLSGFPLLSYVSDSEAQTMRESARQTLCALLTESSATEGEAVTAVSDEEVVLHQAAEDALLAFLLGGSSDIALAAGAEEAARETCRTYARRAFAAQQERERERERLALLSEDEKDSHTSTEQETSVFVCEHWPRPWLLSAYLSGYELLSSSLSLHGAPCEHCVCVETVSANESTEAESSESVDCDCDIDEGVYADTQRERQRGRERAPPAHLLSPAAQVSESAPSNVSENVSERETETKTETTMYELRERDVDAYALLCEIVHELERAIAPSGAARTDKETETDAEKDRETEKNVDTHTDSESAERFAATISHWESFADCETALCGARLVDFGVADREICDVSESENVCAVENTLCERDDTVTAGVVCDDNADTSVTMTVSPSTHFARCLSLCLAQSDLTGVRFTRQGRVDSILFPFSPYEYKEVKTVPPTHSHSHSHSHSHRESTEEEDFARRFAAQFGFSEKDEEKISEEESVWEDCEDCEEESEAAEDESAWESCVSEEESVKEIEKEEDELDKERHNIEETKTAETATETVSIDANNGEKDTDSETTPETVVEETSASEIVPAPVSVSVLESKTEDASVSNTEKETVNEEESEKLHVVVCAEDELDCEHHELAHPEELAATEKELVEQKKEEVSPKLRARLLSLCASLAYLAGDAEGAVQCFEASLFLDNTLIDSKIKLAALLVDMDETDKAKTLFDEVLAVTPTHPVALLHCAELHIHRNAFDEAVRTLRKARHALSSYSSSLSQWCGSSEEDLPSDCHPYWATLIAERETEEEREKQRNGRAHVSLSQPLWQRDCAWKRDESKAHLQSNVSALLGVSLFRENPQRPELALSLLEDALLQFPDNAVLLLCSGEVHSQCGDMVKSIKLFKRVSEREREKLTAAASVSEKKGEKERESVPGAGHPLSWLNAARTYQQLGQLTAAHRHLQVALSLDPSLSMTRVDQAQLLRQQNDLEGAVKAIDAARERARQTSEIRDVLTARYVVLLQQSLKEKGLYDAEISV